MGFKNLTKTRITPDLRGLHSRVAQLHIVGCKSVANQFNPPCGTSNSRLASQTKEHGCRKRGTPRVQADPSNPPQNGFPSFSIQCYRYHLLGRVIHPVLKRFGFEACVEPVKETSSTILFRRRPQLAQLPPFCCHVHCQSSDVGLQPHSVT